MRSFTRNLLEAICEDIVEFQEKYFKDLKKKMKSIVAIKNSLASVCEVDERRSDDSTSVAKTVKIIK